MDDQGNDPAADGSGAGSRVGRAPELQERRLHDGLGTLGVAARQPQRQAVRQGGVTLVDGSQSGDVARADGREKVRLGRVGATIRPAPGDRHRAAGAVRPWPVGASNASVVSPLGGAR